MTDFLLSFLKSNLYITVMIGIIFLVQRLFHISAKTQYNLWKIMLGLLFLPFLPVSDWKLPSLWNHLQRINLSPLRVSSHAQAVQGKLILSATTDWMNDFSISINQKLPHTMIYLFMVFWIVGICFVVFWLLKSYLRLLTLKRAASPLQDKLIRQILADCKRELGITRRIPLYYCPHLKSPMITGLFQPEIYIPSPLSGNCSKNELRYMLLHELCHYKSRDSFVNLSLNIACAIYWFNPCIWLIRKELRNTEDLSCDIAVLSFL